MDATSDSVSDDAVPARDVFGDVTGATGRVREPSDGGHADARPQTNPRLARGIRWSDLVAEMWHEQAVRDDDRAA